MDFPQGADAVRELPYNPWRKRSGGGHECSSRSAAARRSGRSRGTLWAAPARPSKVGGGTPAEPRARSPRHPGSRPGHHRPDAAAPQHIRGSRNWCARRVPSTGDHQPDQRRNAPRRPARRPHGARDRRRGWRPVSDVSALRGLRARRGISLDAPEHPRIHMGARCVDRSRRNSDRVRSLFPREARRTMGAAATVASVRLNVPAEAPCGSGALVHTLAVISR